MIDLMDCFNFTFSCISLLVVDAIAFPCSSRIQSLRDQCHEFDRLFRVLPDLYEGFIQTDPCLTQICSTSKANFPFQFDVDFLKLLLLELDFDALSRNELLYLDMFL